MKNLENKLMFIIKESNLINLFDYGYVKEESTDEGEFAYKYFVNMRDSVKNPLHVSSFEFYNRKHSYIVVFRQIVIHYIDIISV